MSFYKISFGKKGEDKAVKFLKKNGYKILERNYRTRLGEIDIIAKEDKTLAFIEVKNRKTAKYGAAEYAVDKRKQNQITKAALHYISKNEISNTACRFDVVAINEAELLEDNKIKLIKNAFGIERTLSL